MNFNVPYPFVTIVEYIFNLMVRAYNLVINNWILSIFLAIFLVSKVVAFTGVNDDGEERHLRRGLK